MFIKIALKFLLALQVFFMCYAHSAELVAKVPWIAGDENNYVIEVNQERLQNGLTVRELSFILNGNKVNKFETPDALFSAFTLRDYRGCLITLWTTGSAYRIWVFQIIKDVVTPVLDIGTKTPPKFTSFDACPEIVVGRDSDEATYKWDGTVYSKVGAK